MTTQGFIYLIHEKEYTDKNEPVYKVGCTTRHLYSRLDEYTCGYKLLYYFQTTKVHLVEKVLIKIFKDTFESRITLERFRGDENKMIDILKQVEKYEKEKNTNNELNIENYYHLVKRTKVKDEQIKEYLYELHTSLNRRQFELILLCYLQLQKDSNVFKEQMAYYDNINKNKIEPISLSKLAKKYIRLKIKLNPNFSSEEESEDDDLEEQVYDDVEEQVHNEHDQPVDVTQESHILEQENNVPVSTGSIK